MSRIMDIQEFRSRLANHDISRRQINKVLASVGLATVAMGPGAKAFAQNEIDSGLTVFTWAGFDVPELYPAYTAEYGTDPQFALFGEEEEAFQKLRQGFPVDVAEPCTYSLGRWYDGGLLRPIDTTRLEYWDDMFDSLKGTSNNAYYGLAR